MTERLYIVDASGYIFRAFHAVQGLATSTGFPTNALFGFLRMVGKLLTAAGTNPVVMVFDAGRETFRTELYAEYKANRTECPEELRPQMPYFREFSHLLGLPVLEEKGFEADDIIATLVAKCEQRGVAVTVVSGDKDLTQLVSDTVEMWDTMRDQRYGPKEVLAKFGVPPERIPDLLALLGDASDNVPGVSGVGEKTAAALVARFGTTEEIIAHREEIAADTSIRNRKKIAETIAAEVDTLRLSRRLVELRRDVPVPVAEVSNFPEPLHRREVELEPLRSLLRQMEFESLERELPLGPPRAATAVKREVVVVTPESWPTFLNDLSSQPRFAFDTETTGRNPRESALVGLSFSWSSGRGWYLPVGHRSGEAQLDLATVIAGLTPIFLSPTVEKIAQNAKFDLQVLAGVGLQVSGPLFDTMVGAWILHPDGGSFNLTALSERYLGQPLIEFDEVLGDAPTFAEVPIERGAPYAVQDAVVTLEIAERIRVELAERGLETLSTTIEMPLVPILAAMESAGILLDTGRLQTMSAEFLAEIERTTKEIEAIAGPFNLNSPKQLSDVLFVKLGLSTKGLKRTKTGVSTDASVLEKLALVHPLPALILHHRFLQKIRSTYLEALPSAVSPRTGRLHTSFNQTGTGTGRLSSSEPNLQNIPVQTPEGRKIRSAFIARPGARLISADYSQIELRILAHMSEDPRMCSAFIAGDDIHAATAREVLGLGEIFPVTAEQRRVGKTINFGIVYGMSGFRLARDLGVPVAEGNRYIEQYFERYAGVRTFMDRVVSEAKTRGVVATAFGRQRLLNEISQDGRDDGFLARVAMNAPIQGTAADIIKLAMIEVVKKLAPYGAKAQLLLQIHDELLFEVAEDLVAEVTPLIRAAMEGVTSFRVPLKVDVRAGISWDEAH